MLTPELTTRLLFISAQRGSYEALYNLGAQSLTGRHRSADLGRALKFLLEAASELPEARLLLGMLYEFGHENFPAFDTDPDQAAEWYRRGLEAGYCWATYHLSFLWLQSEANDWKTVVALELMEGLAASNGKIIAQRACETLAAYYLTSVGVEPDAAELHEYWLELAHERDSFWICEASDELPPYMATEHQLRLV